MSDPETMTLAPAPGGRVRKPDGSLLADAGETVVIDTYWRRRLMSEDVVEVDPAAAATAEAAALTAAAQGDQA